MTLKEQIRCLTQRADLSAAIKKKALSILTTLKEQEQMPKEEILAYAQKIRPLLRKSTNTKDKKPKTALFWASAPYATTRSYMATGGIALTKAKGLKKIGRTTGYLGYHGYYAAFSPNISEVIEQCPKEWLDRATAFEIELTNLNPTEVYDNLLERHVLHITFYTGEVPKDIARRPVEW